MVNSQKVIAQAVSDLIEQLFRHAYGESFALGLNPAQWAALRFIARAMPSARTAAAFARWQRTTTGTASQTIAALVRKELIAKLPMDGDRRQIRLELTDAGRALLAQDPVQEIVSLIERMPMEQLTGLVDGLTHIARGLFKDTPDVAPGLSATFGAAAD